MSKTPPPKAETEETPAYSDCDTIIVMRDEEPLGVLPRSDRARALFMRWGMEEDCDGIAAPYDPDDLFRSVPANWTCRVFELVEIPYRDYLLQDIPLPQPRIVLQ